MKHSILAAAVLLFPLLSTAPAVGQDVVVYDPMMQTDGMVDTSICEPNCWAACCETPIARWHFYECCRRLPRQMKFDGLDASCRGWPRTKDETRMESR